MVMKRRNGLTHKILALQVLHHTPSRPDPALGAQTASALRFPENQKE